ncbi:MAG: alpha/beta hydrolase [Oscillospiraceae bacterium]|nr:alpha/beta hydrolase [Oscillospiraceae bacterium]
MYIDVNGVGLYYEVTGSGPALVFIHGNSESHDIFNALANSLSDSFTAYLPDSRGHGQSQPVKALHYEDMAEDYARFIAVLGLYKPIVVGFSDGAIIGLMLAAKYPDMLGGLIACGANTNPGGLKKQTLITSRLIYTVSRSPYLKLMVTEPDLTPELLGKITVPTLVTAGSGDVIKQSDTELIAKSIPEAELRIFKGENHSSYVVNSRFLEPIIREFFRRVVIWLEEEIKHEKEAENGQENVEI